MFKLLFAIICNIFHKHVGFSFSWQSIDTTKCKDPVRNIGYNKECLGHNPTDRSFKGTKISVQVDANEYPLGFVIAAANMHDMKLLEKGVSFETLEALRAAIEKFINAYNRDNPHPFVWRKREVRGCELKNTLSNLKN